MTTALHGADVPQPATFAHSKDDILKALSFYFGAPVSPEKLRDYSEHHAATCTHQPLSPPPPTHTGRLRVPWYSTCAVELTTRLHLSSTDHFPDAYAGSNTKIRDTINNLVEKQPQTWHTVCAR
jgi:hypothetical protein